MLAVKYKMKNCLFVSHFWLFWKQQILFIAYGHDESNVVVQSLSCVWLFATLRTTASQASLSFTISWSLFKFMSIESLMLYNQLILCHLILLCLQSFPASGSFPMSWFFASGDQSIGDSASASASTLPMYTLTLEQQSTLGREGKGWKERAPLLFYFFS